MIKKWTIASIVYLLFVIGGYGIYSFVFQTDVHMEQKVETEAMNMGQTAKKEGGEQVFSTKNVTRLDVGNVVEAAIKTSQTIWPATIEDNQPKTVILAPADNWQIAMAAADMIHHPTNGPVLFYEKDQIPAETLEEIERLAPLGSEAGVEVMLMGEPDQKIVDQLNDYSVLEVKSSDAAEFAAKIDEIYAEAAGELPASVIIVSAEENAKLHSLVAANWIAHMPEPVLYVTKDEIPAATLNALSKRVKQANLYVLGPEEAVSSEIEEKLKEFGNVTRIEGNTAVGTSIAFAKFKDHQTGFGWGITDPGHGLVFASTDNPEFAIAGAPFAHLGKHAPLIWLDNGDLANETHKYLGSLQPTFKDTPTVGPYNHAFILGTGETVSMNAQGLIDQMLEIVSEGGGGHVGH